MTSIMEAIRQRRSIRAYSGESLNTEHAALIRAYIASLRAPFGVEARISLLQACGEEGKVKAGTYGIISGARDYLVLSYEKGPLSAEGAAYIFEQAILYASSLGLATCWLGGLFSRKNFGDRIALRQEEVLRIVSPIGYASGKRRLWDAFIGSDGLHASRKPFGTLFFLDNFDTPLSEEAAGIYRTPLEMLRLAPSANNYQPWRVLLCQDVLHFYHRKSLGGFDDIDMGIALSHFGETCRELEIPGHFEVQINTPPLKEASYSLSWVAAL